MMLCSNCQSSYPEIEVPHRCPLCGGIYEFSKKPAFHVDQVDGGLPGIWRYQHTFPLPDQAPIVSLGEGNTPIVWRKAFGREIGFKLEFLNPTGSFKDRGTALLVSFLRNRGVAAAVEDSSGNAGASFAAYAAATGIEPTVYVPSYASGPKRTQIEIYGAKVVSVPGKRSNTAAAVQEAANKGSVYASHVYFPHDVYGYATIAYEIYEQLGAAPGAVITPTGQGSLLQGIGMGFDALFRAGLVNRRPVLVGVQVSACAPLYQAWTKGTTTVERVSEGDTLAEGVRTQSPVRAKSILEYVNLSFGCFVKVEEENILPGRDQLAHQGLFVEPTSAIIWDGLSQVSGQVPDPIVAVLTGSGLKSGIVKQPEIGYQA
jgi:threonine synthase